MCGIAGILLSEMNPAAPGWLTTMTQALHHRGPDDGGAVVFGQNGSPAVARVLGGPADTVDWQYLPTKLGLGARRLAIVDLTPAGHQPMSTADGGTWLVFNGEIYNHAALREELTARGMTFAGHCDTEVLLAAYRAWGPDCFKRLDGMWAVAIVDWFAGRLVLSRDRFGIKPLHLAKFDYGIAFSSEILPLLNLPGARRGVNEARLRDFLYDGRIDHTDQTLFDGVGSLPPGCYIELDVRARGAIDGRGTTHRYWRADYAEHPGVCDETIHAEIRDTLSQSVRSHLQGDAPIGTCLSGGIDSSSIVCLLHRMRADRSLTDAPLTQHAFTAALPGDALDERGYADRVVAACEGLDSHVVTPSPEGLIEAMPSLLRHQEQPFALPNVYMQWEIMRSARSAGIKVLLDGQGGDEIFCGYEGHIPAFLAHLVAQGRWSDFFREMRAARRMHFAEGGLWPHVIAAMLSDRRRDDWRRRKLARRQPWLSTELLDVEEPEGICDEIGIQAPPADDPPEGTPAVLRRAWSIFRRESLPALLRFEDRSSSAFSLEARVPFLSRAMVELAMSIPMESKIRDGVLKAPLRSAMRTIVPDAVLDRTDKLGFSVPIVSWMRGGLRAWWSDLVASRSFADRGCFDVKKLKLLTTRLDAGDSFAARSLWRAALVEHWAGIFLDG
ncbi:MAG: asparagine synthase (glutamine-hydrolyzing) [Phycisphaerae bacterium]|nr:asparagine synthase (glutamine-hydrolyzing) [Phycisphaerae bacterium]